MKKNKTFYNSKENTMKEFRICLNNISLELILTALGEKAWNAKNTPAGDNYKELIQDIKEQINEQ